MRRSAVYVLAVAAAIALIVWRCRGEMTEPQRDDVAAKTGSSAVGRKAIDQPHANLTGRVVSRLDGKPVAKAAVAITREQRSAISSKHEQAITELVVTDGDGRWRHRVSRGRYTIAASARGFEPAYTMSTVSATDPSTVELALEPGGVRLTGTVTDIGGGPIANAQVEASRQSGGTMFGTYATTCDEAGRYEIWLRAGAYKIAAAHDDYVSDSTWLRLPAVTDVVQNFELALGGVIRGRVVTDRGEPVAEATVTVHDVATAVSGDDGTFEVRRVSAGINRVSAAARKFRSVDATEIPVAVGEQVDNVTLVVAPAFVISGRTVVKGKRSEPIADATVGVWGLDRFATSTDTRSDADGVFELTGINPGPYRVGVFDNAVSARMSQEEAVKVEVVDHDVADVVIELEVGQRVSGRVEPPMETSIMPCGGYRSASDAKTGAFSFEHLSAGDCRLTATSEDGWSGAVTITSPASDVAIKLARKNTIRGRVVISDGAPVRTANVGIGDDTSATASDGSFSLEATSGIHRITASYPDDYKTQVSTEVSFTSRDVDGVVLTLPARNERLEGTVVDHLGNPVRDAHVVAYRKEGTERSRPVSTAIADEAGHFVLVHLGTGRYSLLAHTSNGAARGELNDVELGSSPKISLAPLGSIEGRVTVDGVPVPRYQIACENLWSLSVSALDGAYRLTYVPPGNYSCTISASVGTATASVAVTSGVAKLDVALARRGAITGTIVDLVTGEPVPNIFVLAHERGIVDRAIAGQFQVTDAAGRFTTVAAAGDRELTLSSATGRYLTFPEKPSRVVVRAGQTTDLGVIESVPPHEEGSIGVDGPFEGDNLKVTSVRPGKPGDVAGIHVGDVITAINNRPVARLRHAWWQAFGVGKTYRITLARGVTVTVVAERW